MTKFIHPAKAPITQYCFNESPLYAKWGGYHEGVDYSGRFDLNIYAPYNGKVTYVDNKGAYGLHVKIDHGNSLRSILAHMNECFVKVDDYVVQSQIIGVIGNTGHSTARHLHWTLQDLTKNDKKYKNYVDPLLYVNGQLNKRMIEYYREPNGAIFVKLPTDDRLYGFSTNDFKLAQAIAGLPENQGDYKIPTPLQIAEAWIIDINLHPRT